MNHQPSTIRHLRDYVAIPSVNPMGRSDLPADWVGETRLAEFLSRQIRRLGVDAELVGEGQRQSVIAELRSGDPSAETVLVASHIDTVPVDGMEIDHFDPKIEHDRLYGRGSCDTKAGMASLMAACEQVLERGCLRRNLILVGEADEELGSLGVRDVLAQLGTRQPDWVLATEPTELKIVHAHKGVVHIRLEAAGRACHASDPAAGQNAIVDLARATLALHRLAELLDDKAHPLLGSPTLSVGRFEGGAAPNVVPHHAELVADRRILPGETTEEVS
ncbi:M20/M25/M40 family metallo-hydrolase, partial [Myxococcota bacterium]|nr:M20/M25/M40 family metallo-hydrolase [Myxococcota bacterium]